MTRQLSLAIGSAVALVVAAATVALALNNGFVGASAADAADAADDAPVTTTTTYEQYLEEWYAANPTTSAAPASSTSTPTTVPEPVVIYEYVDIPVAVPPPEIIYVEVPAESSTTVTPPPTTNGGGESSAPAPTTTPTTTAAPTPTAAPMELLEFDVYGFADVTVASYGPGDRLQFWQIEQESPWVWEIEDDNGDEIEVKFFDTASGKEAKFELGIRGDGYRLKTEGDGFDEQERNL